MTAFEHRWQGRLVHAHRTRSVTGAMMIYLGVAASLLALAVLASPWPGIVSAMIALTSAAIAKAAWLAWKLRSRER